MTMSDLAGAVWRKSSRSEGNGGACVSVADLGGIVAVRDSKNPDGGVLRFPRQEWVAFLSNVKQGEFDAS